MTNPGSKRISAAFDAKNWAEFDAGEYRVRALAPFKKFRGLDIPWEHLEELLETTERVVKVSRSRKIVKLAAGHFGAPVEVYVKRYNFRTWRHWIWRIGRKTHARKEFDLGWQLMSKGFKTPRPVWLAEAKGALSRYSLLATEALPDVESALDRWMRCDLESQRRELLIALGQLVGQIHDAGFYHDNFKATHLLIFPHRPSLPEEFYIIDLLGGLFRPTLTPLRRAKNLYQIIRSFLPKRRKLGFTLEHRDLFLLTYSADSTPDARQWSKWVDRIGRLKGRKV
ncbi:MAG: lipopolysaccharide kinase InaA family protein [Planctomycetota bacterium]